jgi:hypothetical protein
MTTTALVPVHPVTTTARKFGFLPAHLREVERARRAFAELSDVPAWLAWEAEIVTCAKCKEGGPRSECAWSDDEESICKWCDAR